MFITESIKILTSDCVYKQHLLLTERIVLDRFLLDGDNGFHAIMSSSIIPSIQNIKHRLHVCFSHTGWMKITIEGVLVQQSNHELQTARTISYLSPAVLYTLDTRHDTVTAPVLHSLPCTSVCLVWSRYQQIQSVSILLIDIVLWHCTDHQLISETVVISTRKIFLNIVNCES